MDPVNTTQTSPDSRPDAWGQDWELCFRAAEVVLSELLGAKPLAERRSAWFGVEVSHLYTGREPNRATRAAKPVVEWLVGRWCLIFDSWRAQPARFIFEDGYALAFFLLGLFSDAGVMLRGQVNSAWRITTSLSRWRTNKPDRLSEALRAADEFIRRVSELNGIKDFYPRGLSGDHAQAICQHYGFPTDLVDVTTTFDVALFFAEDWSGARDDFPLEGAIYALPTRLIGSDSVLIALPPFVMRPNLQAGKFLRGTPALLESFESSKFRYRHARWPASRGLSRPTFSSAPAIRDYIYPPSDALELIAAELRV